MVAPDDLVPLDLNIPRPDEPSPSQIDRAAAVLNGAQRPIVLAGHGAGADRRRGGSATLLGELGVPVATTFHGKGVFPDDHPHALGAVGFMSHDYVNFGFDEADVIISVGYELQEFDPARINPNRDKRILHLSRVPAEVDAHYDVEVGVQADLSRTLDALAAATTRRFAMGAAARGSANCWPRSCPAAPTTTASRSSPSGSCPTRGPPSIARTSSSPTPGR